MDGHAPGARSWFSRAYLTEFTFAFIGIDILRFWYQYNLEWSRYLGQLFKHLWVAPRSESQGARWPGDECVLRVLQCGSMRLKTSRFAPITVQGRL